jgi:hypothetical protein
MTTAAWEPSVESYRFPTLNVSVVLVYGKEASVYNFKACHTVATFTWEEVFEQSSQLGRKFLCYYAVRNAGVARGEATCSPSRFLASCFEDSAQGQMAQGQMALQP